MTTVRITVWGRYVDLDRRGVAGFGSLITNRFRVFAVEVERA